MGMLIHHRRRLRAAQLQLGATPPPAIVSIVETPAIVAGTVPVAPADSSEHRVPTPELTDEQLEAATAPEAVAKRGPGRPPNPR